MTKPPYLVPLMSEIEHFPKNGYKAISTFSGCGGSCLGHRMAGFDLLWANEFIPEAQVTYKLNHPTSILDPRDIRKILPEEILAAVGLQVGELDLMDGSPPCFVAGTPVLTIRGVVPIEKVVEGDLVFTHKLRWKKVVGTSNRMSNTVILENRIEVTPDHLFYSRKSHDGTKHDLDSPSWRPAGELSGSFCGIPTTFPKSSMPPTPDGFKYNYDFWYIVGRWVGDGWLRIFEREHVVNNIKPKLTDSPTPCLKCGKPSIPHTKKDLIHKFTAYCSSVCRERSKKGRRKPIRNVVFICSSHKEASDLRVRLARLNIPFGETKMAATYRFGIGRKSLVKWLLNWFDRGALNKTIPGWMLGMNLTWRKAFFDGYTDADGCDIGQGRIGCVTISRCLSSSFTLLAHSLGYTTTTMMKKAQLDAMIEGRKVNCHDSFATSVFPDDGRYTVLEDGIRWRKIRRAIKPGRKSVKVFDIEVEEDHSFVCDSFIVHNCSSFSTAGIREEGWGRVKKYSDTEQRTDDLFFEFARLLKGLQPKVFVAENVKGLTIGVAKEVLGSAQTNMFGDHKFTDEDGKETITKKDSETILHMLMDCGYVVGLEVLNAEDHGVPQSRNRVIFVGIRKDLAAKHGLSPSWPRKLGYRYTVRDAIPWIELPDSDAAVPTVEKECDISAYAIGKEWDQVPIGGTSERFFSLVKPELDSPCKTITACIGWGSAAAVVHPLKKRKFSTAELRRICSFPSDFKLTGTFLQQCERLGRAVPPVMMARVSRHVATEILDRMKD